MINLFFHMYSVVPNEDSAFLCCECCNQFWVLTAVFLVIAISGIISISVLRAFSRKQPNDVRSCSIMMILNEFRF